jgi:hypothetical protein
MDIDYFDMQKWGYSDVLFTILYGKKDDQPSKIVFQTVLVALLHLRALVSPSRSPPTAKESWESHPKKTTSSLLPPPK